MLPRVATFCAGVLCAAPMSVGAAGTVAGTVIQNTATLTYSIGGAPAMSTTPPASFTVAELINVTLVSQDAPPGQFAFILAEETVRVPPSAMAFISMRATFKMKGLVNVSGFHVDPGWNGPLIFAVHNAGPGPVHLQRGLPLF